MLFIHIGPMKTGTSTIQRFLVDNVEALAKQGIIYPRVGRSARSAHHNFAHELRSAVYFNPALGGLDQLFAVMRETPGKQFVISSEMLASLPVQRINFLKERLSGIDIRIISYTRSPASLIRSHYTQASKLGRHIDDFDVYFDRAIAKSIGSVRLRPERWATVFGWEALRVRSLEQLRSDGTDLLEDFLSALGLPADAIRVMQQPERRNESPGWRTVELLRSLYRRSNLTPAVDVDAQVAELRRLSPVRWNILLGAELSGRHIRLPDEIGSYMSDRHLALLSRIYEHDANYLRRALPDLVLPPMHSEPRSFLPEAAVIDLAVRRKFYACLAEHISDALAASRLTLAWENSCDLRIVRSG